MKSADKRCPQNHSTRAIMRCALGDMETLFLVTPARNSSNLLLVIKRGRRSE